MRKLMLTIAAVIMLVMGAAAQNNSFTDKMLRKAEGGDVKAMLNVADCYLNGRGVEMSLYNYEQWIKKAAEKGDAEAEALADGCEALLKEKVRSSGYPLLSYAFYRAEGGDALAMSFLGDYYSGIADTLDIDRAMTMLDRAIALNEPQAMYVKGTLALSFPEIELDKKECIKLIKRGAEMKHGGCAMAMYDLLNAGEGMPRDSVKAVEWALKSAEYGYIPAIKTAVMHYLKNDTTKVVEWVEKGAEQWEPFCMGLKAVITNNVDDKTESNLWVLKAAACGDKMCIDILIKYIENEEGENAKNISGFDELKAASEAAAEDDTDTAVQLMLEVFPDLEQIVKEARSYAYHHSPYARLIADMEAFVTTK